MSRLTDEQIDALDLECRAAWHKAHGWSGDRSPNAVREFARAIESAVHRVDQPLLRNVTETLVRAGHAPEEAERLARDALDASLTSGSGAPGEGNEGE